MCMDARGQMFKQRGVTLVEMMVALVISMLISLAAIQLFLASSQSYRLHEALSRTQENSRFAIRELQYEGRMAGYTGCASEIVSWLNTGKAGYVDSLMGLHAITGWEAAGTAPGSTLDLTSGSTGAQDWINGTGDALPDGVTPIPGTDVLVVNRAVEVPVAMQGNPGGPANVLLLGSGAEQLNAGDKVIAVLSDCSGGELWQVHGAVNGNRLTKISGGAAPGNSAAAGQAFKFPYDDQATLYVWENRIYFIRANASTGEPGLYLRRVVGSGSGRVDEIVEGVEQMQVLYGIDTSGDGYADQYETAASVNDWNDVVSIRTALLLRSDPGAATVSNTEPRYNLIGTQLIAPDDRRLRRIATITIALRNRLE